jgi:predicted RNA polymerase sigma factor
MAQRISRAKQRIRESGAGFALPTAEERMARLPSVLHVLYLVFNEGYAASAGPELHRADLAAEAIRLARMVHRILPDDAEASGLLALMLLLDGRWPARTDQDGRPVLLPEQDRGRWDQEEIEEGRALLDATVGRGRVGEYQLQAAIAAVHDRAATAEETDWPQILALYGLLDAFADNPVVSLNRAVALAMVQGPEAGLTLVDEVATRLPDHPRLLAVRGHLTEMTGDHPTARALFRQAAGRTTNRAERDHLLTLAARPADEPEP